MRVGLLPALGGGIRAMAQSGQQSRLIDGYFRPYLDAFEGLDYFSYLPESLAEFTDDAVLRARVRLLAPPGPVARGRRAAQIPFAHAAQMRECSALRVFQITGVIPALIARRRFGTPYVTTYGFWYGQLSQPGPKRVLKGLVERLGLKHAAAVIATTPDLAARASRLARRVELIPNGVDTTRFRPAVGRAAHKPARILYVGRLSAEKNLGALITALGYVGGDATAVLVGAGPLRADLESQARQGGVAVEFSRFGPETRRRPSSFSTRRISRRTATRGTRCSITSRKSAFSKVRSGNGKAPVMSQANARARGSAFSRMVRPAIASWGRS